MSINHNDPNDMDPKIIAILNKVEEITKRKMVEMYQEISDIRENTSLNGLLEYSLINHIVGYVKTLSQLTNKPALQIYSNYSDTIIKRL